ncbi:MAG: efflux RND transporter permease subunit [Calditrichaeota bacterium]|nr:efflux RND transporter permease subunit [Calditrichota bacterium]
MIERLIEWSLRNRAIVLMTTLFLVLWGVWALYRTPVDAIPDLSDNQVIVMTDWMGRAPRLVEDQVTYPLQTVMQGMPRVKAVRGQSMFGLSMVYVIFDDDVDIYWARSRVLEKLSEIQGQLPPGAMMMLGPDGTGVGHVYWYTVEGKDYDLAQLRSIQDWYLRLGLSSVEGVAEVASIGGFVKEYQVELDPAKLISYGVSTMEVMDAVRNSNIDVGGGLVERSSMEYLIRSLGYVQRKQDLEQIVIRAGAGGVPITVGDVATVQMGGRIRRGLLDKDGEGEVAGGIIVMRYGENASDVIDRVKVRLDELRRGLPPGVEVKMAYDRSDLIVRAVNTLRNTLIEEILIVCAVIMIFLLHFRSALVVIIALPIAVVASFIAMYYLKVSSNLMSLSGIAIAIGVMVDAGIIVMENAYRHLSEGGEAARRDIIGTVAASCRTVGRPIFFSMAIIVLSFVPVFLLEGQEGKLFFPLAMTKTAAMAFSAFLAVTLVPVLCTFFLRGKLRPEDANPLNRYLNSLYRPVLAWALKFKWTTIAINAGVLVFTAWLAFRIGSEFMPALDEGSLLFMPTTLPNVSITEAKRILQVQDKIIRSIPEVDLVLGKVGRAETATDPAPVSMIETIILLKPHHEWRKGLTRDDLIAEMDAKLQIPGVANGWTQPIINRINMLATGVRTDLGIKIFGPDLVELERLAIEAENIVKKVPGAADVFAERTIGGNYIDIIPDRAALARYGLTVGEVQSVIEAAAGGMIATTTVEGRDRYPVRIRYARDFRDSPEELGKILLSVRIAGSSGVSPGAMSGMGGGASSSFATASSGRPLAVSAVGAAFIPLSAVAAIRVADGPPMISSENSLPRSVVFLNVRGRDLGGFVSEAMATLKAELQLPPGYFVQWSGQWEHQVRARQRLMIIAPLGLVLILILLYFVFRSWTEAGLVMLSVPFSLTGGAILIAALGFNWSVAVWVGFIALYGVAVETGVVMVVYLHEALNHALHRQAGKDLAVGERVMIGRDDLYGAIMTGSVARLRPKLMTVGTSMIGLLPILWSHGTGADLMQPIAAPMIGGLLTSAVHVLIVTPVIFALMKERELRQGGIKYAEMG